MHKDPLADSNVKPFEMTVSEKRVMARIFQHPMSHNLSWRETLSLFDSIGAVEHSHNGDMVLLLGGEHQTFKPAHDKDLGPEEVMALRHFLDRAGWANGDAPPAYVPIQDRSNMMIIIDHADTKIYPLLALADRSPSTEIAHFTHEIFPTEQDANREETYPNDVKFFGDIADALGDVGHIVILSHGTGQSNEGDHLIAYFDQHNSPVHARVLANILTDLHHTTLPECLALARDALAQADMSPP